MRRLPRHEGQTRHVRRDLPELQNLTLAEQRKIADRLVGLGPDQILPAYNTVLIDIVADRRTAARIESEIPSRVRTEVEAQMAETNAQRLQQSAAPRLGIAPRAPRSDEPDFRADPMGYLNWINSGGRARL